MPRKFNDSQKNVFSLVVAKHMGLTGLFLKLDPAEDSSSTKGFEWNPKENTGNVMIERKDDKIFNL